MQFELNNINNEPENIENTSKVITQKQEGPASIERGHTYTHKINDEENAEFFEQTEKNLGSPQEEKLDVPLKSEINENEGSVILRN